MKITGFITLGLIIISILFIVFGLNLWNLPLIAAFIAFAVYCMQDPKLKNFAFTIWVLVFVVIALAYPKAFGTWARIDLKILIVPLIQIIMFGMGTTLSVNDFKRVATMPLPVFIGIFLQFLIMPLTGLLLATVGGFEPEVAAGIILIGSCPGGVASNLMAYLGGGNVALSVTMTSCSTLVSPLMTPFLMKTLAGKLVPIDFFAMMFSILNMIIVPVIAGLIANRILYSKHKFYNSVTPLFILSAITIGLAVLLILFPGIIPAALITIRSGLILGFLLIGVVALTKLMINIWLQGPENWMDKTLPIISMAGICFIIGIITARSSEKLLSVGLALIAVSIIHNAVGYTLGYWISKGLRLDEKSSRTIAFEVGMQNGGMASGLAMTVLNSANTALAPAIFGPWMNISGSVLANFWQKKDKSTISD